MGFSDLDIQLLLEEEEIAKLTLLSDSLLQVYNFYWKKG